LVLQRPQELVARERERRLGIPRREIVAQYFHRESDVTAALPCLQKPEALDTRELFFCTLIGVDDERERRPATATAPPPKNEQESDDRGRDERPDPPRENRELVNRARRLGD